MTQLSPLLLKGLEGSKHSVASNVLLFERSGNHLPAAREGGEGYAVPVTQADRRFMLKIYFLPTEERRRRALFLSKLGLSQLLPTLAGAPQSVIEGDLLPPSRVPVTISGHLAPLIDGDTFESLLNEQFSPDLTLRLQLARQLCGTIRVLERSHLVHGDLAMSNVMITGAQTRSPNLTLIDFDGFYHPVVPKVPCSTNRGGRGFGQDGYRHRIYAAMGASVTITSDRAAMAALAFELVTLRSEDFDELNRTTLLDQSELDQGRARTSDTIIARWPEGWKLVERAFASQHPECAPSPTEWYELLTARYRLGATPPRLAPSLAHPKVVLRVLERGQPERRVNLSASGNSFAPVSCRLAWLSYEREGGKVVLRGSPVGPVFLTRGGVSSRPALPLAQAIEPGDEMQWDDFTLQVG